MKKMYKYVGVLLMVIGLIMFSNITLVACENHCENMTLVQKQGSENDKINEISEVGSAKTIWRCFFCDDVFPVRIMWKLHMRLKHGFTID